MIFQVPDVQHDQSNRPPATSSFLAPGDAFKRWVNESLRAHCEAPWTAKIRHFPSFPQIQVIFFPKISKSLKWFISENGTFQSSMKQALLTNDKLLPFSASFVKFSSPGWGSRSYCENSPQWDLPLGRGTRDSSWQLVTVRDSSWQLVTLVSLGYCWCWDWVLPIVD